MGFPEMWACISGTIKAFTVFFLARQHSRSPNRGGSKKVEFLVWGKMMHGEGQRGASVHTFTAYCLRSVCLWGESVCSHWAWAAMCLCGTGLLGSCALPAPAWQLTAHPVPASAQLGPDIVQGRAGPAGWAGAGEDRDLVRYYLLLSVGVRRRWQPPCCSAWSPSSAPLSTLI